MPVLSCFNYRLPSIRPVCYFYIPLPDYGTETASRPYLELVLRGCRPDRKGRQSLDPAGWDSLFLYMLVSAENRCFSLTGCGNLWFFAPWVHSHARRGLASTLLHPAAFSAPRLIRGQWPDADSCSAIDTSARRPLPGQVDQFRSVTRPEPWRHTGVVFRMATLSTCCEP